MIMLPPSLPHLLNSQTGAAVTPIDEGPAAVACCPETDSYDKACGLTAWQPGLM